jgi:hypothetical protein
VWHLHEEGPVPMALGDRIRQLRKEAGWSQAELGDKIGTDSQRVAAVSVSALVLAWPFRCAACGCSDYFRVSGIGVPIRSRDRPPFLVVLAG